MSVAVSFVFLSTIRGVHRLGRQITTHKQHMPELTEHR